MTTRVIVPPGPLLTPADIPGNHSADDARIALVIAAAQGEIDGPEGWLGRALGPQTLETAVADFDWHSLRLTCPPIIDVLSIGYIDRAGSLQTANVGLWEESQGRIMLRRGQRWPQTDYRNDAVRVTYTAGYDGNPVIDGGTGPLPAQVKMALQLAVTHTVSMGVENLFLRSEEVEGIGTTTYTISTVAADLIKSATERLLGGLRLYA